MHKTEILQKIDERSLTMGVVGLGYVGLPLAVEKAKAGFITIGFDIMPEKVRLVNEGINYIGDVVNEDLKSLVAAKKLRAVDNFDEIGACDFIAVCVPTPLDEHHQPDVSYIKSSFAEIAARLRPGQMVVLESTTYPGTTEDLIRPILEERSGLVCGEDFYLGFSPERVDPGNLIYKTRNTPKVVGAIGADAAECISAVYAAVLESDIHVVSTPRAAEMEKILENTYRNVNIGLINELTRLCHLMDIDIWEVIEAAKTKPYGFQAFYPGPGLGGHCIPLDPCYLAWKAREYNFHTAMIEASTSINDGMPEYCVSRCADILNDKALALRGSRILVLGASYKQDIDDCRESPAIAFMEILLQKGVELAYHDPYVPEIEICGQKLRSIDLEAALARKSVVSPREDETEALGEAGAGEKHLDAKKGAGLRAIEDYDLVVIATAHTKPDYAALANKARVLFDLKNAAAAVPNRGELRAAGRLLLL